MDISRGYIRYGLGAGEHCCKEERLDFPPWSIDSLTQQQISVRRWRWKMVDDPICFKGFLPQHTLLE